MTNEQLKESFLMYINPDDRDMARGALESLLSQAIKEVIDKAQKYMDEVDYVNYKIDVNYYNNYKD